MKSKMNYINDENDFEEGIYYFSNENKYKLCIFSLGQ